MTKKQRLTLISVWISAILLLSASVYITFIDRGYTEVCFIDVGQGDSCFIQTNNLSSVLIDGGDLNSGNRILSPFLRLKSVNKLDAVFVSHLHSDHLKGIEELMADDFEIKQIYMSYKAENSERYEAFKRLADSKNISCTLLADGDTVTVDNTSFTAVIPACDYDDENNSSLVLRFECGVNSILFTGDIASAAEEDIISDCNIDTDIVKVPHHGSASSSGIDFINAVSPEISVISVGKNNKYKHPSEKTVYKYNYLNIPIIRTDYDGTISFIMTVDDIKQLNFSRKREVN